MSQVDTPPIVEEFAEQAGFTDTAPAMPAGTTISPEEITTSSDQGEIVTAPTALTDVTVTPAQAAMTGLDVATPTATAAAQYQAYAPEGTPEAVAAQGHLSSEAIIGDVPQGVVSAGAQAVAATGELDQRATTKYQLEQLFASFEQGQEPPAWASPAMRSVTAMMQARGLGSSSMASAAIVQGLMEAAVPIAKADADKYAAIQLTNLNNQQQATMQNALTFASMDKANLDARMKAAVNNAQSFLQIDTQNLSNEQRIAEVNHQSEMQKLFTDQAAENAARQFNAASQTQVDQFFAQLDVSVQAANKNRQVAQEQFNVSATNALRQYQAGLNDNRDQFNANMQAQINQSNAQWRREINTANTAAANEAARINAQNLFNLTANAQNNLWQAYRDDVQWAQQSAENSMQRAHQITVTAMEIEGNADLLEEQLEFDTSEAIGRAAVTILDRIGAFSWVKSKIPT